MFLSVSRQKGVAQLVGWIRIASGELLLSRSSGFVPVVSDTKPGGCRLRKRLIGVTFVEPRSWTMYAYSNGVT